MGFLSRVANELTGGLIGQVGDVLAKTNTTDKERLALQNDLTKIIQEYELKLTDQLQVAEQQITERSKIDMGSDSWLSKNIRPMVMAFLTLTTVLLAYVSIFALPLDKVALLNPWIEMLQNLDLTVFTFYFGSRGIEKIGQMVSQAWGKNYGSGTGGVRNGD